MSLPASFFLPFPLLLSKLFVILYTITTNPLKMQYMTNTSIMRVGGGIFESYLPHSEHINSLCRTTSHYIVWEGDNPSCLSIAVATLSHWVACLAAGDSRLRPSLSTESVGFCSRIPRSDQRTALPSDSPEHLWCLSRDWHWARCLGRPKNHRVWIWTITKNQNKWQ